MRRRRFLTYSLYFLFVLFILMAFIISRKIVEKQDENVPWKEDFTILRSGEEISALYYDGENVWVGCNDGVYVYNADTREEIKYYGGLNLIYSAGITKSSDGTVWIGQEDGLTGIQENGDGDRLEFSYPDIPKGRVNTVEWDGERLWIGTYHGAASLIRSPSGWKVESIYNSSNGLCSDSVNVIKSTGHSLWFASYLDHKNGGISIWDNDGTHFITVADGLPHAYVTSLQYLGDEKMLVGTGYMDDGGLALVQKINGEYKITATFFSENGVPGEKVRQLFLDEDGYLWITTEYDGVLILNYAEDGLQSELQGLYLKEETGLSDNEIKCLIKVKDSYWLGGKYGLTIVPQNIVE